ncbi:MAG: hypothetical protein ACTSQV_09190, partial [Alphaproteobacteria bacterium]
MIGSAWHRQKGMDDPVLARMSRESGHTGVPLFEAEPIDIKETKRETRALGHRRDGVVAAEKKAFADAAEASTLIKEKALEFGAARVGITALQPMMIDLRADLPFENVIAIIVQEDYEQVPGGPDAIARETYRTYRAAAETANALAAYLREELGWPALAHHTGGSEIQAIPVLYHAGFGELGKHGSLINPDLSAGFRPGFVTTNLPLTLDSPIQFGVQDRCLNCRVCENFCPGDAIPNEHIETLG